MNYNQSFSPTQVYFYIFFAFIISSNHQIKIIKALTTFKSAYFDKGIFH